MSSVIYRRRSEASKKLAPWRPGAGLGRPTRTWGRGRKGSKRAGDTALAVAKRALRAVSKVRNQVEVKMIENTMVNQDLGNDCSGAWPGATGAVIGNGGAVLPCLYMIGGTADNQRIGERIHVEGFLVKGSVLISDAIGNASIRFILARDNQQRSASVPIFAEYMQFSRTNALANWDSRDRFTVFMDETVTVSSFDTSGAAPNALVPFEFSKKLNFTAEFNNNLAAGIEKNGLYLFVIADYGDTAGGDLTATFPGAGGVGRIDMYARTFYTDA